MADLNPGPAASGPASFSAIGNRVYYQADDGVHGRELFAFDLPELGIFSDGFETGDTTAWQRLPARLLIPRS